MTGYGKYLSYVLRHKWFVLQACADQHILWRGILHDWSKFLPTEFIPYARFFYPSTPKPIVGRDSTGYYKPTNTGDAAFDFAWLLHQKRNKHHWQWWTLPEDEGGLVLLEIREPYLTEMICDWKGAGMAQGKFSPHNDPYKETRMWWAANNHKMQIHQKTRQEIERRIGVTYA